MKVTATYNITKQMYISSKMKVTAT